MVEFLGVLPDLWCGATNRRTRKNVSNEEEGGAGRGGVNGKTLGEDSPHLGYGFLYDPFWFFKRGKCDDNKKNDDSIGYTKLPGRLV